MSPADLWTAARVGWSLPGGSQTRRQRVEVVVREDRHPWMRRRDLWPAIWRLGVARAMWHEWREGLR